MRVQRVVMPSANSGRPGQAASSPSPDPSPSDNDHTLIPDPETLAADASRSPTSTHPPRSAPPQAAGLKIIFFSVVTRQAIRRGSFTSVKELTAAIGAFIDSWNDHPAPFAWTKDADEILGKIERAKTKTIGLTNH